MVFCGDSVFGARLDVSRGALQVKPFTLAAVESRRWVSAAVLLGVESR